MRPRSSAATTVICAVPIPSSRRARPSVTCRLAPATTVIGGEPASPSASRSQPARSSTACRAAARAVTCAIWQPVVKPNEASAGSPNSSLSQLPATCSATSADGPSTPMPAHWSQVEVSQSAASAAGTEPPITKPK